MRLEKETHPSMISQQKNGIGVKGGGRLSSSDRRMENRLRDTIMEHSFRGVCKKPVLSQQLGGAIRKELGGF